MNGIVYHILTSPLLLLFIALKTIGNDFVFGFIQAVDGEKVSYKVSYDLKIYKLILFFKAKKVYLVRN